MTRLNRKILCLAVLGRLLLVSPLLCCVACDPVEKKTPVTVTRKKPDKKKPAQTERVENRLLQNNKNRTILVLASEPDVRAARLSRFAREVMTPEQRIEAEQICDMYHEDFVKLLRRRAEVLETATDDNNVDERLEVIYQETLDLSQKIRLEVRDRVLTNEQRKTLHENHLRTQAEKEKMGSKS